MQWAFVYIEGLSAPAGRTPKKIRIDNSGCRFEPYVQGATIGDELEIVNSDGVLHTVRGSIGPRTLWNLALPIRGMTPDAP